MKHVRSILKEKGEDIEYHKKLYRSLFYRLSNEEKDIFLNDFFNRTNSTIFFDTYSTKWNVSVNSVRDYLNRLLPEGKSTNDYPVKIFSLNNLSDEEKNNLINDFKLSTVSYKDRENFLNKYSQKYNLTKKTIMKYARIILKEKGENSEDYRKVYKSFSSTFNRISKSFKSFKKIGNT